MEDKQLFRFGEFSLSVDDRSLRRGDENIALTPKMYELLLVLVQNPNRIVEKEFLLRTVWPDSFVEEGNITFNIRQLRKALGDSAQEPTYIETIPRRGYRFLPEVESSSGDHRKDTRPTADTGQVSTRTPGLLRSRPTLGVLVFLLLVAVMGSAVWFSRSSGTSGLPIFSTPFATEKLSTDGRVTHAAITPDGKTVVYVHIDGKKQSLWIRQIETSNNVQIIAPTEDFYGGLDLSPDGSSVYVARVPASQKDSRQFDIYRVPMVGGVPQKVVDQTQGWISVSPDGERLSYVRCAYKNADFCSLWVANSRDGGDEHKLVSRPRPLRIGDNQISPDGRKVAFAVGQSWTGSNDFSFMEVDIESGAEREITDQKFFNINFIAPLPDGWLLSALRLPDKNYRIWRVPSEGGEPAKLTADSETYSRLSLDAAGKMLVATRIEPDFKLNIYQTENAGAAPRLLADGASVTFSPDNKIYYSTAMTGDAEIWSINADGTDQRQLTNDPGNDFAPIISPDNKTIFFSSNRSGELQVWRMGLDGSNQAPVTSGEGGFPLRVSPDGMWVYYRSGLQSTLRRVSVQDGHEELAYVSHADDFALSPDTSRIAQLWHKNNEYTFDVVSLADNKVEATFRPPDTKGSPGFVVWSNDGKDFAYIFESEDHENRSLWFQSITGPAPRKVADLGATEIFELSGFALSNDTRSFIIAKGTWNHNAILIKGLKP